MLGFLKKLFGGPSPPAERKDDDRFQQLNVVAPLKSAAPAAPGHADATPPDHSFVVRETVLGRDERVAGYEFSLSRRIRGRLLARSEVARKVYDDALLRNLDASRVDTLLGHRLAFATLSPLSLDNALLDSMTATRLVLILDPRAPTGVDVDALTLRLSALRRRGLRHGWQIHERVPHLLPLLAASDFVQFDAMAFDGIELASLAAELRRARPADAPPMTLFASGLQTHDDFHLCFQQGFDLFQGPFVASRENWVVPKSDINRLRVIELLNMIRGGEEFDVISARLKTEPVVTFKLLRYINSPAIGLQHQVKSIAQGLVVLGRDKFYRWLSLLLFDSSKPGYRERMLTEQALTRARFMECLAGQGRIPAVPEQLFVTGLFSLLDALMGQPIDRMLDQVKLPEAVCEALRGHAGPLRDALRLARAMEANDPEESAPEAAICGIDEQHVWGAMVDALAWVQVVSDATEP